MGGFFGSISRRDVVLDVFFEVLAERLMDGEAFNIPRFATFKPVQRAARTARNVLTREVIHVAPQRTVKLVVSDHLKRRLNEDVE